MSGQVIHYAKSMSHLTSCGHGAWLVNIASRRETGEVTCGLCLRTTEYKKARAAQVADTSTEAVGIPTPADAALGVQAVQASVRVHMMSKRGDSTPYCVKYMKVLNPSGYSTMDLGAVNCPTCLESNEFTRRNDEYTKMMSPTLEPGQESPVGKVHDEDEDIHPGVRKYTHDCEACVFLGQTATGHDLYWCDQNGRGGTVIIRYGNNGPDYESGLNHARTNPWLALAVVRAFKLGLVSDDDMGRL